MINSKIPPPSQKQRIIKKAHETALANILAKQIKHQDHLHKVYTSQIQQLQLQKQLLTNRLQKQSPNPKNNNQPDKLFEKKQILAQSQPSLKQKVSIASQSNSPSPKKGRAEKNQSPFRKLQTLDASKFELSLSKVPVEGSLLNIKYSKQEEIMESISELLRKISLKQQKSRKQANDEIAENLLLKISQQESNQQNLLQRWKQLNINKNMRIEIQAKMKRIRQEIFKQNQGIKVVKQQHINRNKEIIKSGYTSKMLQVISIYAGARK